MSDEDQAADKASVRSLAELFDGDLKRFEWMAKQYYDLFAYHAAQRLTAFNFFLVSLSFFSTAYATLISKSESSGTNFFRVASALALAAYLLVIAFGRLDKRNEQIIGINEKPLIRIQRAIRLGLAEDGGDGDEVWETFVRADRSVRFRTFSQLLPTIYSLAATACAGGTMYGLGGAGDQVDVRLICGWLVMGGLAIWFINFPLFKPRKGEVALEEANKVKRLSKAASFSIATSGSAVGMPEAPSGTPPVPIAQRAAPKKSVGEATPELSPAPITSADPGSPLQSGPKRPIGSGTQGAGKTPRPKPGLKQTPEID